MDIFSKLKAAVAKAKIASAVASIALGGKGGKILGKIDQGEQIAEKALAIAELVKELYPKKK